MNKPLNLIGNNSADTAITYTGTPVEQNFFLVSNSWQLGYAFWPLINPAASGYDPNQLGEYEIRLEALDPTGTTVLAGTTIFAQTVPEPATMALTGLAVAGLCAFITRRRRQG